MKKILLATGIALLIGFSSFAQNYINGIVSLHGESTASGTTIVAPGASLTLYKNKFYVQAGFINQGDSTAISADSGTLVLSGDGSQGISGRFKISALEVNNNSVVSLSNIVSPTMITILDSVKFGDINNGILNAGDSLMTLRSTADKTAQIADLTNNETNIGNAITGKVVVERFLRSQRAWRLLGPPTTADSANDHTISNAWQEGARAPRGQIVNPHPGYGTVITRPGNNPAAATGYDDGVQHSSAYSLKMYTSNGLYTQPANTDSTHFSSHAAYFLFIRGDRSVSPKLPTATDPVPSTITTLRSKGALHNGIVVNVVSKLKGKFAGVANPYACTIDFSKATITGIDNGFYVYDPTLNTVGAWVYIDGTDNYNATPAGVGLFTNPATNKLIQSGQAILVLPTVAAGSVIFRESNKNISNSMNGFRMAALPSIDVNLYKADSTDLFLDGAVVNFDASFSKNAVLGEDINKSANINENVAFYASGQNLIKEKWPLPVPSDTLPMRLWNTAVKKYRLRLLPSDMPSTPQAFLFDKYLNISTEITGSASYDFEVTKDAGSKATDRFSIVFGGSVLPVTLTQIKAAWDGTNVNVKWTVHNETDISSYDVERSTNGISFTKIGTVAAHNTTSVSDAYSFADAQPAGGDNFYRIKIIDQTGSFTYSGIAAVSVPVGNMTVTVYPNPVKNGLMKLLFKNAKAGKYQVQLYSSDGKMVFSKAISHSGGTTVYTLPAGMIAQGLYHAVIHKESDIVTDIPVIIE